jgi:hypothetical protein
VISQKISTFFPSPLFYFPALLFSFFHFLD